MKIKSIDGEDFEVLSSNEKCLNCIFQCEVIIKENKIINIYCQHPEGPGPGGALNLL